MTSGFKYAVTAFLFILGNEILSLLALSLMTVYFGYDLLKARFGE